MKRVNRIVFVMAAAIALAAPLAWSTDESGRSGNAGAADGFAPYSEDYTRGEPIPPEMLKRIEHAKPLLFPEENPPRAAGAGPRTPRRKAEGIAASSLPTAQSVPFPKTGL